MTGTAEIPRLRGTVCGNGVFVESESGRLPVSTWRSDEVLADGTVVSFYVQDVCGEGRAYDVCAVHTKPPSSAAELLAGARLAR